MVLGFLKKKEISPYQKDESSKIPVIKLTVVAFEDDCLNNSGKILAQFLEKNPHFEVCYYDDVFDKKFLDLQSRNFFDFIDTGKQILKKTKSEILIWGHREQNNLRLNFQTSDQYEKFKIPFFSLLNSLYLPIDYFQERTLSASVLNLIVAIIFMVSNKPEYMKILRETVENINSTNPPKDLDIKYMPYILNLLALTYLTAVKDNLKKQDIKIVSSILKSALTYLKTENKSVLIGLIYTNFGQIYQLAADLNIDDKYINCKFATDFYNLALKYFPRYTYPYDFGHTAYQLSKLYFDYWRYSADIQFLRNAVFQLREAQKVFTQITFPYFWATIQKDLGQYLSMIAIFSRNKEILTIAIDAYKNYQKVYNSDVYPIEWAEVQENIGNILFECGKIYNDEEYFDDAMEYYVESLDVYEKHNIAKGKKRVEVCLAKIDENIFRISNMNLLY